MIRPVVARRRTWVILAVLAQVVIALVAVAPQLSARLIGTEYRLRVELFDPIDPFRGAYVQLAYPDLPTSSSSGQPPEDGAQLVFISLATSAGVTSGVRVDGPPPAEGPYLRCRDDGWRLRCGIESYFLPQADASAVGTAVREGSAVARVRVDSRGNAALISLDVPD